MRKQIAFILSLWLLVSGLALAETKIAVVDLRAALFSSNAAKQFGDELRKDFADEESKLKALGDDAKALQERLQKDAAIMVAAERDRLAAELEDKAQEFNYLKQRYQSSVSKREENFLKRSKPDLDAALEQLIKDGGYDVVLHANTVIFASPALDITPKLIDALNK